MRRDATRALFIMPGTTNNSPFIKPSYPAFATSCGAETLASEMRVSREDPPSERDPYGGTWTQRCHGYSAFIVLELDCERFAPEWFTMTGASKTEPRETRRPMTRS